MDPSRGTSFGYGYNFRLTNLGSNPMRTAERRNRFSDVAARYAECRSVSGHRLQPIAPWGVAPWLFCITVTPEFGRSRDELADILYGDGIESRPFFIPLHRLPPFRDDSAARREILPVTDQLSDRGMNLPTHAGMTTESIDMVVTAIARARR
ncbi:MAG: DegT/DnrJ/EryC1/StrS family aminotransferase [Dehalococcoidia bacterium]|nr:DegT/DnrJ/EryC1/StrS family aminotransferase [Dehalococcoidia bacterium]